MADPTIVFALPIQIRAKTTQNYYQKEYHLVRYAYCLLDLAAEDSKSPSKVFAQNPAFISEEISPTIKWQLPCRTNGRGYLVAVDEKNHTLMNVLYRSDSDALEYIDRMPTILANAGMRFNLFWTYDRKLFQDARDEKKRLFQKELQLHRCSTMLNSQQRGLFLPFVWQKLNLQYKNMSPKNAQELMKEVEQLLLRRQADYKRFVIHAGAELIDIKLEPFYGRKGGSTTTYRLTPHLPLDDEDLWWALKTADNIREAADAPQKKDALGSIAILEHVLSIIKKRGTERSFNKVINYHWRCEQFDSCYSNTKWNIERSFTKIADYIEDLGKRLWKLHQSAIDQANAHYSAEEAADYVTRIQNAAGICDMRSLWDNLLSSEDIYKKKMAAIKAVQEGQPAKDPVESLIASYSRIREPVKKGLDFIAKMSEWIEGYIPRIVAEKPDKIGAILDRLNHLINVLNKPDNVSAPIEKIFKLEDKLITITVKDEDTGALKTFLLHERIGKVKEVAVRIAKIASVINLALSLRELINDPNYKNYLKAFKNATTVANAFETIRKALMKNFELTESALVRIAGAAVVAVALVDAVDHFTKGNNIAVLGDMIISVGGTVQILSRAGAAGWVAAGVILVGTLVVFLSLDKDEKFLIIFNDKYWPGIKGSDEHRFLKQAPSWLSYLDDYIKTRESEA